MEKLFECNLNKPDMSFPMFYVYFKIEEIANLLKYFQCLHIQMEKKLSAY